MTTQKAPGTVCLFGGIRDNVKNLFQSLFSNFQLVRNRYYAEEERMSPVASLFDAMNAPPPRQWVARSRRGCTRCESKLTRRLKATESAWFRTT
jgi:hypothetical protein